MKDTKISTNRKKKAVIVAEVAEKVNKAKGMVFTNYQGLTHQQLEHLKRALKKVEAEYVATKNTLLMLTLKDKIDTEANKDKFTQPTATLFIYNDIVEPLKLLAKTIKEFKMPLIKFGLIEGRLVNEAEVSKLATLPPLPILRAQLLGQMQSPIAGLHRALRWNLQTLVLTLNAVKEKKS